MKSLFKKHQNFLLLIASFAVSLYSSAGIARILGLNPIASGRDDHMLSTDELSAIKARFAKFRMINEANPEIW